MEQTTDKSGLPANAYRELKQGEAYMPVMPSDYKFKEVTPWSVIWGLFMAVLFSAAAAYSGLKIGQVLEAAIPISIIAVGASTFFNKKRALGQNVIIQSIGASSGVIVAGAIFTMPALYILGLDINFFQIFFSSLLGGFLGILFLIPYRKYFVKEMHGKFPFPEATANHDSKEPTAIIVENFSPTRYPKPTIKALTLNVNNIFDFSANVSPMGIIVDEIVSFQSPKAWNIKS